MIIFFFFQAEDGIRDVAVTGVQTCALPISGGLRSNEQPGIGSCVGLVPTNALGSRNATGRISREQTSERIVAVWGKRPEFVARLPTQMVNDKGRYHSLWPRSESTSTRIFRPSSMQQAP